MNRLRQDGASGARRQAFSGAAALATALPALVQAASPAGAASRRAGLGREAGRRRSPRSAGPVRTDAS